MTLTRLSERLGTLPLVLSGPLLRRAEPTGVTVFVALREARSVTLRVYESAPGGARGALRAEGTRQTIALGKHLHVVAVTAAPTAAELSWGALYQYDLAFGTSGTTLLSDGVLVPRGSGVDPRPIVAYVAAGDPGLPSFALAPQDLNQLRLLHGSCRKANGPDKDLLPIIDDVLKTSVKDPIARPHQLYLTGDQIYADDVPDGLLALLTDAGNTLLDWIPKVPLEVQPPSAVEVRRVTDAETKPFLAPGGRQRLMEKTAGFTSGAAKSHLLTIAEFYAQYLFAWSNVLWPSALPEFLDVYRSQQAWHSAWQEDMADAQKSFELETRQLAQFKETLPKVRRALANVPSYMMFDDHEVTDDWFIFLDWSERVLRSPLGFHVIQNGLAAYAVFQGWGNTPDRFAANSSGEQLLKLLEKLTPDPNDGVRMSMRAYLGPPDADRVVQQKAVDPQPGVLDWHYTVSGPRFEVVVLDTRTWRSYDQGEEEPASMISAAGFRRQLPLQGDPGFVAPPGGEDGVTLIVAPGPVIDVDYFEWAKEKGSHIGVRHKADVENWRFALLAYERLFSRAFRRRARIVLLSGDVHYGFSARMAYWARRPYEAPGATAPVLRGVAAQACSSAMRNGWGPAFSRMGYMSWRTRPAPKHYAGWHEPTRIWSLTRSYHFTPGAVPVAELETVLAVGKAPDWRYRVDYVLAERSQAGNYSITAPSSWDEARSQATYRDGLSRYKNFLDVDGAGKELVGENNFGELRFRWESARKELTHTLWWRMTEPQIPFPHSVFRIPLDLEPEPPALSVL